MKCKYCGTETSEDWNYCPYCRTEQKEVIDRKEIEKYFVEQSEKPEEKKGITSSMYNEVALKVLVVVLIEWILCSIVETVGLFITNSGEYMLNLATISEMLISSIEKLIEPMLVIGIVSILILTTRKKKIMEGAIIILIVVLIASFLSGMTIYMFLRAIIR